MENVQAAELPASPRFFADRLREMDMTEPKATTDNGGLSRVAKGEAFEVDHLVETTGITIEQARALLRRHGNDWAKIREEARLIAGSP
jgi:hypothetical protein